MITHWYLFVWPWAEKSRCSSYWLCLISFFCVN